MHAWFFLVPVVNAMRVSPLTMVPVATIAPISILPACLYTRPQPDEGISHIQHKLALPGAACLHHRGAGVAGNRPPAALVHCVVQGELETETVEGDEPAHLR